MKQNSQWLSQVRTRSNRAASTSMPSGSLPSGVTVTGQLQAAAPHVELELGLVGQQLVLDDVSGDLAVHGDDLVAGEQAGPGGGRPGGHRHHARQRHSATAG